MCAKQIAARNDNCIHKVCSHLLRAHLSGSNENTVLYRLHHKGNDGAKNGRINTFECLAKNSFFTHYQQRRGYRSTEETFCSRRYSPHSHPFYLLKVNLSMLDEEIYRFVYFRRKLKYYGDCRSSVPSLQRLFQHIFRIDSTTRSYAVIFRLKLLLFAFTGDVFQFFSGRTFGTDTFFVLYGVYQPGFGFSIRSMTTYVREHEDEFVETVTKLSKAETEKALRDEKRELERAQTRVHKLDTIIRRLYEDNVEGKISDERFSKMSESYEVEQKALERRIADLRSSIAAQQEIRVNVNSFVALVRKHTDIRELSAEIVREFVERVEVFQPAQVGGRKVQRLRIVWNCIGEFAPP